MNKVLTNGCFDLLHPGHVEFLKYCKAAGEVTVLLNTDLSIRNLKGDDRPIIPYADRSFMLASLQWVDHVHPWSGDIDSFRGYLQMIMPDYYVKGGDYTEDNLNPEELQALIDYNVETIFVPTYRDYSTTKLCQKLQSLEMR